MIEYFAKFYFTIPIQIVLNTFFVIACIVNYKKIKGLRSLLLYSILALIQCIFGIYVNVIEEYTVEGAIFLENTINIFMVAEFIIFYLFLIKAIKTVVIKKILKIILVAFTTSTFYLWISSNTFNEGPATLTVIESYLVIISCLFYYYELFKIPSNYKIFDSPIFWTITGMLFLFTFLMPFFLQRNNIFWNFKYLYKPIYSMTFIGYILLFTFFINALKCQIKQPI